MRSRQRSAMLRAFPPADGVRRSSLSVRTSRRANYGCVSRSRPSQPRTSADGCQNPMSRRLWRSHTLTTLWQRALQVLSGQFDQVLVSYEQRHALVQFGGLDIQDGHCSVRGCSARLLRQEGQGSALVL
jgi:hypothetical protein